MLSLGVLSFIMARKQKQKEWKVVGEHLLIGVAVVLITNYVGGLIAGIFA